MQLHNVMPEMSEFVLVAGPDSASGTDELNLSTRSCRQSFSMRGYCILRGVTRLRIARRSYSWLYCLTFPSPHIKRSRSRLRNLSIVGRMRSLSQYRLFRYTGAIQPPTLISKRFRQNRRDSHALPWLTLFLEAH